MSTKDILHFGSSLKRLREHHNMTQKEFAKAIGYSNVFVSDLEGARRTPSVKFVKKLCAEFGLTGRGYTSWQTWAARANGWDV